MIFLARVHYMGPPQDGQFHEESQPVRGNRGRVRFGEEELHTISLCTLLHVYSYRLKYILLTYSLTCG